MWKVGDRAICITPGSDIEGLQVEVTSGLVRGKLLTGYDGLFSYCAYYQVEPGFPRPTGRGWAARPQNLKPIPDDKSTWSELEKTLKWNPSKLVTVEIEQ